MTHQVTRRRNHARNGHPEVEKAVSYAVACQCPVCRCARPVEAKPDGLAICDRCKELHYPTD